jgi:hypothetical protein
MLVSSFMLLRHSQSKIPMSLNVIWHWHKT